jgi:hypothetical protein
MLLNSETGGTVCYAQEKIDRNIIPLLIPPYQMIVEDLRSSEVNEFNLTYVNNIP